MNAPIEKVWEAHGLKCIVKATDMGHRCGYVMVPKGHPWHGLNYSDCVPLAKVDMERPIGSAIMPVVIRAMTPDSETAGGERLDVLVEVHGGLTYSGETDMDDGSGKGWWLGFDCAHCYDSPDAAIMSPGFNGMLDRSGGHVWLLHEVIGETENLARQVAQRRGAHEATP